MKLTFDARARAILKRLPAVNAYSVLEIMLLAGLAVQVARLAWVVVTPVAPLGEWRPAGPTIPMAPADVLRGADPFYRGGDPDGAPAVVTSLHLTLYGTRINEATGRGSAILAGPDGVQKSVAVGEEVAPGVVLKEVAFDHVTLDRGGAREDLFLDQSNGGGAGAGAVPVSAPAAATAPQALAAGEPIALNRFQADIGFVPRIDGGRIIGLVVRPQGSAAAFRAAGLMEGDIVTAIGGRPVNSPADFDAILGGLKNGGTLSLTVLRGGQSVPLSVPVAPR
ncbi:MULTISPECIES: type II secretion system protein N [unclassified Sphingomonas]|uniref:type II secretion system protein N n=1 Tax=unclassified Sphingomonas TaxID=196159 RepID=UPI0009277B7E|nr:MULTISPECIES: type II secretion system protein N [unclassified Sphingomonas]MBN8846829.1 PDZ domain-containing protein [Sphingomonas sp.]OJV33780.1 MAG: type II secretory protein PulC [Sphingomonas sp. 67-36]